MEEFTSAARVCAGCTLYGAGGTQVAFPCSSITTMKEWNMDARHGLRLTTLAAVVAALSLAACDKPATDTTARRTEPMTATTPATEAKEKIAAATDKMATAVEDSTLTAKVKAALLAEPGLSSLQISVETKNGAVTLSGSVDTAASKDRAKEVASKIEGVAMVVDQMSVKSS